LWTFAGDGSVEDAASEVERKAMAADGGGAAAERLHRSIDEMRRVRAFLSLPVPVSMPAALPRNPCLCSKLTTTRGCMLTDV